MDRNVSDKDRNVFGMDRSVGGMGNVGDMDRNVSDKDRNIFMDRNVGDVEGTTTVGMSDVVTDVQRDSSRLNTKLFKVVEDHMKVEQIFNNLGIGEKGVKTLSVDDQMSKIMLLIKELSLHSGKEEMVLYPLFEKKLGNQGKQLKDQALQDHLEMKHMLYDIDTIVSSSSYKNNSDRMDAIKPKLHALHSSLVEHIKTEENTDLPLLEKALSVDEANQFSKDFVNAASRCPTRPHPSAPSEPPMNTITNPLTKPFDALRDMAGGRKEHIQDEKTKSGDNIW
jgi:hemerythrin-like domain-containing protein